MEAVEMTPEAWVKTMFLDGCFILQHLVNYARGFDETELHQSRWAPAQLRSDLTLLENQIPFTVLVALFNHLAPRDLVPWSVDDRKKRRKLLDMALWYMFRGCLPALKRPADEVGVDPEAPVHHLLQLLHLAHCAQLNAAQNCRQHPDLCRFISALPIRLMRLLRCLCMCDYEPRPGGINHNGRRPLERDLRGFVSALPIWLMRLLRCLCMFHCRPSYHNGHMAPGYLESHRENVPSAVELKAMGIRIMRPMGPGPHHGGALLDVRFVEERVRLEIPPLYVDHTTAPLLQNLVAFEQQESAHGCDYFTTYAILMYNLLSTPEDITLLQRLRILHNNFGSDEQVINYFKKLCIWNHCSGLTPIDEVLKGLWRCRMLPEYRDWAEVKNYINSPVKILLLIISSMVALSTVMQAILAIRPPAGH